MKKLVVILTIVLVVLMLLIGLAFYSGIFNKVGPVSEKIKTFYYRYYNKDVTIPNLIKEKQSLLEVNQLMVKVLVKSGAHLEDNFIVYNKVGRPLNVEVSSSLSNVNPLNTSFVLNDQQEVIVAYDSDYDYGVKAGKIYIVAEGKAVELPVIVESESQRPSYDVNLDISPSYLNLKAGQTAQIRLKLFNLINQDNSVDVDYNLYGLDGKVYLSEKESLGVNSDTELMKSFVIPSDIQAGTYVYGVKVSFNNSVGVGSYVFNVQSNKLSSKIYSIVKDNLLTSLVLIILLFLLIEVLFSSFLLRKRASQEIVNIKKEVKNLKPQKKLK